MDGAWAEDCVLDAGAGIKSGGQVSRSLLLEGSSVERLGHATDSVIGPNTQVAKGEVTASLLGPFVGFHHQALLIGALWPEGCGNVGYGANVGSNHTGRKPDQEIRPGEGAFFGLGCSIKFPANFSEAPYSLFATGVTTLPQRLAFPFSLIAEPSFPIPAEAEGLNEILPGWMWSRNAYALVRSAYKYQDRNRAPRHPLPDPAAPPDSPLRGTFLAAGLFAPGIARSVVKALETLRQAALRSPPVCLEKEIAGLGKNFLRREHIGEAVSAYADYLRFALCRLLLWRDSGPEWPEEAKALLVAIQGPSDRAPAIPDPGALLQGLLQAVETSLAKDEIRGRKIFDDYAEFHASPSEDPVCRRLAQDLEKLREPLIKRLSGQSPA
jgi:hypothetical protein